MKRCKFCGSMNDDFATECKTCQHELGNKSKPIKRRSDVLDYFAVIVTILGVVLLFMDKFKIIINMYGVPILILGLIVLTLNSKISRQEDQINELKNQLEKIKKDHGDY